MLLLHTSDFSFLDDRDLSNVPLSCAVNEGKWLKYEEREELKRYKIKHTWKTPKDMSDKITGLMNDAIGRKSGPPQTPNPIKTGVSHEY